MPLLIFKFQLYIAKDRWYIIRKISASYHVAIVSPGTKFHEACLLVEREVFDINFTRGFINGRRFPLDAAIKVQDGFRHDSDFVVSVGTATNGKS